jgi:hypothetical protein
MSLALLVSISGNDVRLEQLAHVETKFWLLLTSISGNDVKLEQPFQVPPKEKPP